MCLISGVFVGIKMKPLQQQNAELIYLQLNKD